MKTTVTTGVRSLLQSAADDASGANGHGSGIYYLFDGDLSQMSHQEDFLRSRGFDVGRRNVYPGVATETEFQAALKAIWENRAPGWWHYRTKFANYGICSEAQFDQALQAA